MAISQTFQCVSCGFSKSMEELFLDLSLEHSNGGSVQAQLEHFMATEGGVEWKCPKEGCGSNDARLGHRMARSPRILVLQLKRFAVVNNEFEMLFLFFVLSLKKLFSLVTSRFPSRWR